MAWNKIYRRETGADGNWVMIFCGQPGNHLCQEDALHFMVPIDLDDAWNLKEEASFAVYNLGGAHARRPAGNGMRLHAVPSSPAAGD